MKKGEWKILTKDWSIQVAICLFAFMFIWWAGLHVFRVSDFSKMIWGASYQAVAIWGALWGLTIGRTWGGFRSVMGRAILAFSFGLLMQDFGQTVFFYYNMFASVEIPYPSIADVGYFGSIPFYIYGAVMLAQASGAKLSLKSLGGQLVALVVPLAMLAASYLLFLRDYAFDWSTPVKIFLDYGYPFGQAIYVSFAILAFLLTQKTLGGTMKQRVLLILLALVVQYIADGNFLFQAAAGSWTASGYGDLLYLLAYFLMTIGLLNLHTHTVRSANE